ncbi:MAG TPA: maleylacetoacetate isomerase [Albidovulum sp.]|uniref:maleylacetoacetate isomerase n=1 Tax=Albidovulum sp. TaxID=1872424 RepID=UPI002CC65776|nr:maleylacetoacetate isomerase [Albidovulum sp.]
MITLYDYWRSSASYRVRIALNLAGLDWRAVAVNLADGEQREGDHLARNPQGLVPVLEIDGHRFTQSLAIIEYLDETRGLGLLPADAPGRARVRALAHAVAMEIHPVCNLRVARYAADHSAGGITMDSWMREFIAPGLAALEKMVDDGDYCYRNAVTLPDLCLVPQLYNARRWGVDLAPLPRLTRIGAHLEPLPAFAAARPEAPQ